MVLSLFRSGPSNVAYQNMPSFNSWRLSNSSHLQNLGEGSVPQGNPKPNLNASIQETSVKTALKIKMLEQ